MARLLGASGGSAAEAKHLAEERIAELDRLIEQAMAVKEFLTHVLACVHDQLGDCPQYAAHLRERADRIRAGDGGWPRPTAVSRRPPGTE
jgi:hypothetical protein